ncbi:MAG: sporulation integral membrane protein YtvI [Eubacteriales bacterium]|nr:sporulation integral membrane protein YtvI [Eubacteriales bacterium]
MKRWQIGLNIIYEIVTFLGTALLLVIFLPKLLGFFWPFVASWILALLAAPLCSFLEKRIRLNKKWASALIIIVVLLILAGLGYLIITKLGREMISFLSDAPEYYYYFQNAVRLLGEKLNDIVTPISEEFGNQIQTVFNDLLRQIGTIVNNFAPGAVEMMGSAAANITNGLVGTLVMILSAYFFIAEREKLSVQWMKLIPEDARKQVGSIWKKLMEALGGFLMAQFKIMFVIFLILLAGLILLRNPYAFFLALLISFLDLLPVLGTGTVLLPWALVVFLRGGIRQGVILVVLYFVCLLTRQLLQPKIIGDSIGMETLPTLFLIYTGFKLKGMGGMILFLLLGTVAVSLYRLGLFDRKLQRMKRLIREYRKQGNRVG